MPDASVQHIFDVLREAGLSVSAEPDGALVVSPGSRLTPDLRELVKGNKAALLDYLHAVAEPAGLPDRDAWRVLAHAYHAHHFNCPTCIAASRSTGYSLRCGTGSVLHAAYETAWSRTRPNPKTDSRPRPDRTATPSTFLKDFK